MKIPIDNTQRALDNGPVSLRGSFSVRLVAGWEVWCRSLSDALALSSFLYTKWCRVTCVRGIVSMVASFIEACKRERRGLLL